jgi:hypothetical protein
MIERHNRCTRTGWPIDISIHSQSKLQHNIPHAVYFLLQEELCYNTTTKQEEPLGLQRLMVRQMQTISDFKVHFVTENQVSTNMSSVVTQLFESIIE